MPELLYDTMGTSAGKYAETRGAWKPLQRAKTPQVQPNKQKDGPLSGVPRRQAASENALKSCCLNQAESMDNKENTGNNNMFKLRWAPLLARRGAAVYDGNVVTEREARHSNSHQATLRGQSNNKPVSDKLCLRKPTMAARSFNTFPYQRMAHAGVRRRKPVP